MCGGEPIPNSDLEAIQINVTDKSSKDLLPMIHERELRRRANSEWVVLGISDEWYVTEEGEDVTKKYIRFPSVEPEECEKQMMELNRNVFIVHGTDQMPVKELKVILAEVGLNPIILCEQSSRGMTLIEKLHKYSDVGFAFIVLTPDDLGLGKNEVKKLFDSAIGKENWTVDDYQKWSQSKPLVALGTIQKMFDKLKERARQNVVLEFGFFMGRLNRDRICCLYKGDIELPLDMQGLCYVHFNNSLNEVKGMIVKELRDAGYEIKE